MVFLRLFTPFCERLTASAISRSDAPLPNILIIVWSSAQSSPTLSHRAFKSSASSSISSGFASVSYVLNPPFSSNKSSERVVLSFRCSQLAQFPSQRTSVSWLIEGARKVIKANYQITRPQCVLDAIGAYREGNDWLGTFINECCEVDKSYQEKSGELYRRYREYCNENGEYIRSTTDFYTALEQAGYKRKKTKNGVMIYGVALKIDFLD